MSRFHERLQRDLDHIADRSTPSSPAWEAIQTRIVAQVDDPEMEIIMLDKTDPPLRGSTSWILSAAAALIVVIGGLAVFTRLGDDPSSVEAIDTTPPTSLTEADYLAAVDAYFDAFNSGDDQAVLALLTTDAALYVPFDDTPNEPESDQWKVRLIWSTSEGTVLRSPSCTADDQPPAGSRIICDYETRDAVNQAVDAPPVPTTTRFVVTSSGLISEIRESYGTPDFTHVGVPFQRWLRANHPDLTCLPWLIDAGCDESAPDEVQRAIGALVPRYAQEFKTYLEAHDCTYLEYGRLPNCLKD